MESYLRIERENRFSLDNGSCEKHHLPRTIIAAGRRHSVALKSDGRVLATGDNNNGQCEVGSWRDIREVAAGNVHMATNTGNSHTVGLRSDGTAIAVG